MPKRQVQATKHIIPLNMNRLEGRMLSYPSNKKRQKNILFVYGQHSSIERWWGLAQALHDYGSLTIPDLPGFGGMDSFYKIGKVPSLDNYAAYLASFIKLRYRRRTLVLIGTGFGFVVITRMLQKYPDLKDKVKLLVSLDGLADHDDLAISKNRRYFEIATNKALSRRLSSFAGRHLVVNNSTLKSIYMQRLAKKMDAFELEDLINDEVGLWRVNDLRTHYYTSTELLSFTNCNKQVELAVWHVANDKSLDYSRLEQHMRVIFSDFIGFKTKTGYSLRVLGSKKSARMLLPLKLRKALIHH